MIRNGEAGSPGETSALRIVLKNKTWRVIALGGGAWTLESNRALIAEHGCFTVWLDASFELCWRRITTEEDTRPLALDRRGAHQLYDWRRPLYELAALLFVDDKNEDEMLRNRHSAPAAALAPI